MSSFFIGLTLLCASTLTYEVVLTRLLSTISWYYLAFVAVSTAMFGMTAGALAVQLKPEFFAEPVIRRRAYQGTLAAAISMPIALVLMLAIPFDISFAFQTVLSFLIFSAVIAVPFFFSGVVVCISLTRMPFPMGQIYFADLMGAALGCGASVALLRIVDAPSAIFVISALLFASAAAYAQFAGELSSRKRCYRWAAGMVAVAALNAATIYGIQPIWAKGSIDRRGGILAEIWTPISKVRALNPVTKRPFMWGPSPALPDRVVQQIPLNIDNDAGTTITRFDGDLSSLWYLRYDVTAIAAQLRQGGTAAVIGVGGGRDVLNCAANGFTRIVGIEINSAIADLASRRLDYFSGFSKIPGFELHNDEGRSYLTRSGEHFDLIQASLVDTWAATSAGAMALSENALYSVDGWRVFFEHLKPGGIITFSRWYSPALASETYRLYSVAYAMLLSEGVAHPREHLALIQSGQVATLLASNQPFPEGDLRKIQSIADELSFKPLVLPGKDSGIPEIQRISSMRNVAEMASLEDHSGIDLSPTFDTSPYFFNGVHLRSLVGFLTTTGGGSGNLLAIMILLLFLLAAIVLVMITILLPARKLQSRDGTASTGGVVYFIAIGLGFMLVEIAMMQQLSIFLGHPVYSLVVVLGGLVLSAGLGSLASDRWPLVSGWQSRVPALAAAGLVMLYSNSVIPVSHAFTAAVLWQRVLVSIALVAPCGFLLGFCFPVGMRWMTALSQECHLPWMWALNGAAGTLGSFAGIMLSMDTSIQTCVYVGIACYVLAGAALPAPARRTSEIPDALSA